jgi:hypothetical protein
MDGEAIARRVAILCGYRRVIRSIELTTHTHGAGTKRALIAGVRSPRHDAAYRLLFVVFAPSLAGCLALLPLDGLTEGGDAASGEEGGSDATSNDSAHLPDGIGATDATSPIRDAGQDGQRDSAPEAAPADGEAGAPPDYRSTVLADDPLAYLRVDESTSTVAHDATGNGNNGQYVGGFTLGVPGALLTDSDPAVSLDGSTGYIDFGNLFPFVGTVPMTLEIWAKPSALTTNYPSLFSRQINSPRSGYFMFVRDVGNGDSNTFGFERWNDGGYQTDWWQTPVSSSWHYFVGTFDGSTSRAYVDGQLVASNSATQSLGSFAATLQVGTCVLGQDSFAGAVDEIAVYGAALSQARISAHYHASGR